MSVMLERQVVPQSPCTPDCPDEAQPQKMKKPRRSWHSVGAGKTLEKRFYRNSLPPLGVNVKKRGLKWHKLR